MNHFWGKRRGAIVFWLMVIVPLAGLFAVLEFASDWAFFYGLLIYAVVYRPILNIVRLLRLGKISRRDIWKFYIPFYEIKYTKSLWWG